MWSVEALPDDAVEVELPSGFAGAFVRRVVCSLVPAGDDVDMALVLDAGMDRCLYFTPVDGEQHGACCWGGRCVGNGAFWSPFPGKCGVAG